MRVDPLAVCGVVPVGAEVAAKTVRIAVAAFQGAGARGIVTRAEGHQDEVAALPRGPPTGIATESVDIYAYYAAITVYEPTFTMSGSASLMSGETPTMYGEIIVRTGMSAKKSVMPVNAIASSWPYCGHN